MKLRAIASARQLGTPLARLAGVTVAIPIWQNRVSPVLDAATRLLLIRRHRGREVGRKETALSPMPAMDLARSVAGWRVDVLLCAAVSEPLRRALEARGVKVQCHVCGNVEEVLRAFCGRRLGRPEFRMPGCWQIPMPGGDPRAQRRMRRRCCRRDGQVQ